MNKDLKYFLIGSFFILIIFALILIGGNYLRFEVTQPKIQFGGYLFTKVGQFWYFDWYDGNTTYNVPLRYNPVEVRNVTIMGKLTDTFNNASEIFITFDPLAEKFTHLALAAGELGLSMHGAIGINPIAACTINETAACVSRPVVTCNDKDKAVIYLKIPKNQTTGVYFLDNCIVLVGQEMDLLRAVDRLLYNWYGILI